MFGPHGKTTLDGHRSTPCRTKAEVCGTTVENFALAVIVGFTVRLLKRLYGGVALNDRGVQQLLGGSDGRTRRDAGNRQERGRNRLGSGLRRALTRTKSDLWGDPPTVRFATERPGMRLEADVRNCPVETGGRMPGASLVSLPMVRILISDMRYTA